MTRRLLITYLGLALSILVMLEIPLAVLTYRHERDLAASQAQSEAVGLALVVLDDFEHRAVGHLQTLTSQYRTATGGEVSVVDASGHPIASSDRDRDDDARREDRSEVNAALSGRPSSSLVTDEGDPTAVAAVPITVDGRVGGAVLLSVPATEAQERIHATWLALVGFAVAVIALTAVVGRHLARSLALPLGRLEATVNRLGQGDLAVRAATDEGPSEMRSLAQRFNQMAGELEELVDAQNRFVADASHQLRSPLTALRLRLENLESELGGDSGETLAAAGGEVQRLSRLVDGLLTLGRASGDRPERRLVDLSHVISERCSAWASLAEERRVRLEWADGLAEPVTAEMVPGDLEQILDNLLANALDVSPETGAILVGLRAAGGDVGLRAAGGDVEIHVADEGPGMSAEERTRAFDRFWQGPGRRGGSSGLGLAIVRQLAVRNDTRVTLQPTAGTGLEVVLHLPACAVHPLRRAKASSHRSGQ